MNEGLNWFHSPTINWLPVLPSCVQNPELAFGGGNKLGNSPRGEQPEAKKLSADEKHYHDWQEHL